MSIKEITADRRFIVAGHRGFSHSYPENTLLSLQKAVDVGVGMVEFDIGLSQDGVPVLCHDETLDRTTSGTGLVNDYRWSELQQLDAGINVSLEFQGTRIPSFEEVCEWALRHPALLLNVDMKSGDTALEAVEPVVKLIVEYDLQDRSVFNSNDPRIIHKIHDDFGFMVEGGARHFTDEMIETGRRLDAVCLHSDTITSPEVVKPYKRMGKVVWCWGAEDVDSINRVIDAGITLAVCDNPVLCIEIARMRGLL